MSEADIAQYVSYALAVLGVLQLIAKFTPTPKDDKILGKIYDVISSLSPNDRVKEYEKANKDEK